MRQPILKYMRIATSALCLTACLLLIALWVRSYWKYDVVVVPICSTRTVRVITAGGHVSLGAPPVKYFKDKGHIGSAWSLRQHMSGAAEKGSITSGMQSRFGVHWSSLPRGSGGQIIFPFWMFALFSVALGTALLIKQRWRFSLRTLLIAVTLIAVALGIVAISI